ncbi:MAG: ABC transporter ATP-binding protein [Erysipelotrichales bacterium]|nr:ABC transporter ATP-binding protein [Erysipelotrichales bacterium]
MFKLFKKYLKPYLAGVIAGPAFKVLEAIFELIVPLIVKNIIDIGLNGKGGKDYILQQGLILLALAIIGFMTTMTCQYIACKIAAKYRYDLDKDLYHKINTLSLKDFDKYSVSTLQTRLSNDVLITQRGVAMLMRLLVRAPLILIGGTVMSFIISPRLGIIFVIVGVLIGLILFVISKLSLPHNKRIQKDLDDATNITKENLVGARVIRAFNKQKYEKNRFNDTVDTIEKESSHLAIFSALLNPLVTIIANVGIILIFYFGASFVNTGSLTQGDVSSLINYMVQISLAVVVVGDLVVVFSKASASSLRINEVLETEPKIISGNEIPEDQEEIVKFDNVFFSYHENNSYALKNINFSVKRGEVIGLIGSTGSGKSTIINLLDRLYDISEGQIIVNGINIKDYDLSSLRKNIGIVHQKSSLFKGTIRSNLLFANKDAREEEMYKALKTAQALDVVLNKENKLDSVVEEGGKNFSGGQRQRLCIARALMKNPDILVLDDSSSALDYMTDLNLRNAIKDDYKNTTVFIISQRPNSLKYANKIIVLEEGSIVGIGKHDELVTTCKVYKEICDSQDYKGSDSHA